ncbi:hypothetical protein CMV_021402 [Castanea mollissima]|uniref:Uncharacterized protein n=1 Tax=Castanea mollissima TaxID=60419 RepID=A0A8J4VCN9_9ROSI|nr:hypothetical protein CMV_021402 [Castanea mollissima]
MDHDYGCDSENATRTGLDGASSSMNQAVSEIPVPATVTDGGSLSGAVENTDERVAMDDVRGTENVLPEMKHPKLEKGKRSQDVDHTVSSYSRSHVDTVINDVGGDFKELLGPHEALEVLLDHHGNLNYLAEALASASWIEMFPSTVVEHVPSTGSDHSVIFIPLDSVPSAMYKEAF